MCRKLNTPAPVPSPHAISAAGYCHRCCTSHELPMGDALLRCNELMDNLTEHATIDMQPGRSIDPRLSTDYLFGEARGKMFGVMECRQKNGDHIYLRAFSGQYNSLWQVDGWVPPLFNLKEFYTTQDDTEKRIKLLGRRLEKESPQSPVWTRLREERRKLSQQLMGKIHGLYRLNNFCGHSSSLTDAWSRNTGIPTGTGDCCGPKLLNYAAQHNLTPISIAEFYWGRENRSSSRKHGRYYPSCDEKCAPILGFMLCGLEKEHDR